MSIRSQVMRGLLTLMLCSLPLLVAQAQSQSVDGDVTAVSGARDTMQTLREERKAAEARDRARLAELSRDADALKEALEDAGAALAVARERRQADLETQLQAQSDELSRLEAKRVEQSGDLDAVFSAVAGIGGELRDELSQSWLTLGGEAQLPSRLSRSDILDVGEIESLADSLMTLTRETARVTEFNADVAGADGQRREQAVVRIGALLAASNGQLLERSGDEGRLVVTGHTPRAVAERLAAFQQGSSEVVPLIPSMDEYCRPWRSSRLCGSVSSRAVPSATWWSPWRLGAAGGVDAIYLSAARHTDSAPSAR